MAATRRSRPADAAGRVLNAVGRSVRGLASDAQVGVALSGGRDSVALLDAVLACGALAPARIVAIHVHHGLSRRADDWLAHCEALCERLRVRFVAKRVQVDDAQLHGVEAAARTARYAALREAAAALGVSTLLLAHHQDDQAETLLLQLFRGAGPHGLAAMSDIRDAHGIAWRRPLLSVDRATIDAYVRERGLAYVDDDSNVSDVHRRNALRRRIVPVIADVFPGYPATVARAADHQAEAAQLADDLATLDAREALVDGTLDREALLTLAPHRARNLLRWFLRRSGLRAPSTARLAAMLDQLATPRIDARIRIVHDGAVIGVHAGLIAVHAPPPPGYEVDWRGEQQLALPHGTLVFARVPGEGLAADRVDHAKVTVRPRAGGERFKPHAARPRRALKAWLYEAAMPPWQREALPLVFVDGVLAAVPSIGVDVAFLARPGEPGYVLDWRPADATG